MTQTTFLPHLVPSMNVSRHLNRRDVPLSDISIFRKKMNKLRSGSYYAEPVFNDSDNSTTTKIITVFPLTTPKRVKVHVEKASFYPSAMSCRVTVICEHSFFFDAGFADKGITSGIISYHLHHVDRLLRRLDFGDDGRPDYLGLRLHNIVYSNLFGVTDILWKRPDFSCKTLFDAVRNASTVEVCYVLVYTHIDTIDCPPKSYSWGAKNELEIGGICGNKEKPNVGVVNFRDAKLDKLLVDGVKRVLEVMIQAFGNTQMEGYKVEMVNQDENQIFDKRALDIMSQGLSRHSKCLTLTVPLRKKPVFDYYDDDGAIHVFPPWTIILIPAVVMIVSQ